jgi:cellulose synthase/poly-beta-1,6-N-acetylglucosamine synthase-like glycosyltransferase
MAFVPYFILSPNAIMSIVGFLRGPDKTVPTPAEDWQKATVNVVIPAYNEEANILQCIASVTRQTMKPERIIIVDDGSMDRTIEFANQVCTLESMVDESKSLCQAHDIELVMIKRASSIGKTPTLKRQAREFDADVVFILDGDTILSSDNYIERAVFELYQGVGIASACGTILPMRDRDRMAAAQDPVVQNYLQNLPEDTAAARPTPFLTKLLRGITNMYRGGLYMFLQKFIYRGQMTFFGSITNPVGCAVAYRRKYVKELFDKYEPVMGDDLTNSEDIFIGFAMIDSGYRNIQLGDVYALTVEPPITRLPRQIYMWSSSYYQCCYYFDHLLKTPFRLGRNIVKRRRERKFKEQIEEKRKIKEQYRQRFGDEHSRRYGRPMGWIMFTGALEKIFFPVTLLIFAIFGWWWAILYTLLLETGLTMIVMAGIAKGHRFKYLMMGLLSTPIRYSVLFYDLFTLLRFGFDLWVLRTKRWRK